MGNHSHMEIERKWMVSGWPEQDFPLIKEEEQNQGYVTTEPTVRIREENVTVSNSPEIPVRDAFILCFKSSGRLARKEIEFEIEREHFDRIRDLIGLPLIEKIRRTYLLPDGHRLEVNLVDPGMKTEFMYAEVEFESVEEAENWEPESVGLGTYLSDDVTKKPGQSMGEYWVQTRQNGK